jgi:hypothetical protein
VAAAATAATTADAAAAAADADADADAGAAAAFLAAIAIRSDEAPRDPAAEGGESMLGKKCLRQFHRRRRRHAKMRVQPPGKGAVGAWDVCQVTGPEDGWR